MSLTVGFQLPADKKLAGLVVLSGYLPAAQRFRLTPGLEDIPVFHGHGSADPMVRFQWAEATKSEIEKQVNLSVVLLSLHCLIFPRSGCHSLHTEVLCWTPP